MLYLLTKKASRWISSSRPSNGGF